MWGILPGLGLRCLILGRLSKTAHSGEIVALRAKCGGSSLRSE